MNDTGYPQGSGAFAGKAGFPSVPDHKLLRRIGEGSYGEVWLGRGITGAIPRDQDRLPVEVSR